MKSAREMFEDLGYKIYKGFCYIEYTKEKPINRYQYDSYQIRFNDNDKKNKYISKYRYARTTSHKQADRRIKLEIERI